MRNFVRVTVAVAAAALCTSGIGMAQAEKIEAGKKVYGAQKCQTCHAIAGTGGKASSPLDGVGSKLTAAEIKAWITNPDPLQAKIKPAPKVKMKKYTLPDADLDALVTYLASLKK
jgi:mono/diheme cytochrome c family protein